VTSKERLQAALNAEPTDRPAWSPNLAYWFNQLPEKEREKGHMGICREIGADLLNRFGACPVRRIESPDLVVDECTEGDCNVVEFHTPVGSLRRVHKLSAGKTAFLIEHPLKSVEDYKVQLWMEEHARFERDPSVVSFAESLDFNMLIPGAMKSAFQHMIEHLAGTQQLVYDLMDYPDEVESLYQAIRENNRKALSIASESELEYFLTWEDSSTQNYSPAMYAQYIEPEISEWCRVLGTSGKKYVQHACGHIKELIPAMERSGIFAVESLSPVPTGNVTLADARSAFDNSVAIIGGIEPTELLNRSLEDLGPYVEQTLSDGLAGPFILANADSCPPGVTYEKFRLITEIVKSWKI
jgi:hypothetical protein